jgi:hypothetical protein
MVAQSFLRTRRTNQACANLSYPTSSAESLLASCVVMVPPKEFCFNQETAEDNEFQNQISMSDFDVQRQAMREFRNMVTQLREFGVDVLELDYELSHQPTPDAVFPNNWFSTTHSGDIFLFPMANRNRRVEVRARQLQRLLATHSRQVTSVDHSLLPSLENGMYLESTGVMIKDHFTRTIYAGLSQRCDRALLESYAKKIGYSKVVSFQTQLPSGSPVYHTNVMMAMGERFVVICDEVIPEFERRYVLNQLSKTKQIISISIDQMNQFCGNVLELENQKGEKCIAMSQSAFDAWTPAQHKQLASHGKLLAFDVSTIETIGGGSVRCMLAEVFNPKLK